MFGFNPDSDLGTKTAFVVWAVFLAAYATASAAFCVLGGIVALQWPNPRILCYTTSYSDIPSGSRPVGSTGTPSSLYRLNLGFNYLWLILLVVMAVARDVQLVIMCVTFQVAHVAVVLLFRMKFKRYGRPEWLVDSSLEMGNSGGAAAAAAAASLGPGQAVGNPVHNVPMQIVLIAPSTPRIDSSGGPPPYQQWHDTDCLPPASGTHQAHVPPPAGAAGGSYFGGPGPYPVAAAAYPPQPAASPAGAAGPDGSGFVLGQPVHGLLALPVPPPTTQAAAAGAAAAAAGAATAAAVGAAGGRASLEASGHVGATAGAAAAAGAGPVGATGQQQQPQQPR